MNTNPNTTNTNEKEVMIMQQKQTDSLELLANKIALSNNNFVKYAIDKAAQENRKCYLKFMKKQDTYQAIKTLIAISSAKKDMKTLDILQELLAAYKVIDEHESDIIRKIRSIIDLNN